MAKWDLEKLDLKPSKLIKTQENKLTDIHKEIRSIRLDIVTLINRGDERNHPLDSTDWDILTRTQGTLQHLERELKKLI